MAHKTWINRKMVNIDLTIDEINKTITARPLHKWDTGGVGYVYIWSPKQFVKKGIFFNIQLAGQTGYGSSYNQAMVNNHTPPRYMIKITDDDTFSIPINIVDIGSPTHPSVGVPQESYPKSVVRGRGKWGDIGEEQGSSREWSFAYRYEWEMTHEPLPGTGVTTGNYVDFIISEQGLPLVDDYYMYNGVSHPRGRCRGYRYPKIDTSLLNNPVSGLLDFEDLTDYTPTCAYESEPHIINRHKKWHGGVDPKGAYHAEYENHGLERGMFFPEINNQ